MTHYRGRNSTPGYHCAGKDSSMDAACTVSTSAELAIEQAVADAFLEAITPAAVEAMRLSVEQLQTNHDAALSQWRLEVERRATKRNGPSVATALWSPKIDWSRAVWKPNGRAACAIWGRRSGTAATRATAAQPLDQEQLKAHSDARLRYSSSLACTTSTDRDRKELLRTLLEEVSSESQAGRRSRASDSALARRRHHRTGCLVPRFKPMGPRTDEDTISLASPPGCSLSR
jgi:hypothetical protein